MPRLLDPVMSLSTGFQTLGTDVGTSEILAIYFVYVLASLLMYVYVKNLFNGDVVAAFVAALFFITNINLITDGEVTAINGMDMALSILPCLVAFTLGVKKKSTGFMMASGFLFALTYAFFPNFRASIICLISMGITLLYLAVQKGLRTTFRWAVIRKYLKYMVLFLVAAAFASVWIVAFVAANFDVFAATYFQTPTAPDAFSYMYFIKAPDTVRLIAQWGFYSGELGKPYVPYASTYLTDPLVIAVSYIPPALAFAAAFLSKNRKAAVLFIGISLVSLALTNGVGAAVLGRIPFLIPFRVALNWIYFVVFAFSILIGLTISALHRRIKIQGLKILALILTVGVFFASTYPLFTGDVGRNWLSPEYKGVQIPPYFSEVQNIVSARYWTIILPARYTYVVYNTSRGFFDGGNPYPFMFSKSIITGLGTEYVQPPNADLLNNVYSLATNGTDSSATVEYLGSIGIKYLLVENNVIYGNYSSASDLKVLNSGELKIVAEWDDATLYENPHALEKLYATDNAQLSWVEKSPVEYVATAKSDGPFMLVFLQNYDSNWVASVNDKPLPESNHIKVNGFANAWNISSVGDMSIKLRYETQNLTELSVAASVVLCACLIVFQYRKKIKQTFMRHQVEARENPVRQLAAKEEAR